VYKVGTSPHLAETRYACSAKIGRSSVSHGGMLVAAGGSSVFVFHENTMQTP